MTTVVDAEVQLTVVSDAAGRMRVQATGFQFDAGRAVAIEDTVGKVAGVQAVHAYPRTASIVIWYSRAICDTAAILSAIIDAETVPAAAVPAYASRSASNRKAGVVQKIIDWSTRTLSGVRRDVAAQPSGETSDACCDGEDNEDREPEQLWQVAKLRRAAFSGVLLTASLVAAWAYPLWPVVLGLKALALAVGASTFVPSSLKRLAEGRVGVGTLMTIAALGAVALGELGEAATLAFLFSISEGLEEYATARTRRGLRALLSLVPDQATVLREGTETIVASTELHVGDQMIVKPGERLATDGIIRAGRTALDVSAITGESVPVEVGPGDEVFAGSINGLGVLQVGVTATAANNSLARIVHIVEAEQVRKGASQRLADCIARPLVPSIMIAAALIAGTGSVLGNPLVWIERALVVLVAAAPCALAIAVPVTVVASIGAASRLGVLIKGGAALETLGTIRAVALDKTGTLTANRPVVIDVATTNGATREEVLAVAAALEARSEHPLAVARACRDPSDDRRQRRASRPGRRADRPPRRAGGATGATRLARCRRARRSCGVHATSRRHSGSRRTRPAAAWCHRRARRTTPGSRRGGGRAAHRRLPGDDAHRRQPCHRCRPGSPSRHRAGTCRIAARGQGSSGRTAAGSATHRDGRRRSQRRSGPGRRRPGNRDGRHGNRRRHRNRRRRPDGPRPAASAPSPRPCPALAADHGAKRRIVPKYHHRADAAGVVRDPRTGRGRACARVHRGHRHRQRRAGRTHQTTCRATQDT